MVGKSFTTTTPLISSVYALTLMDTMKSYFKFEVYTMCGIPKVKLIGSREDWARLIKKVKKLAEFELEWWISSLIPILEKFLKAYEGEVDTIFW